MLVLLCPLTILFLIIPSEYSLPTNKLTKNAIKIPKNITYSVTAISRGLIEELLNFKKCEITGIPALKNMNNQNIILFLSLKKLAFNNLYIITTSYQVNIIILKCFLFFSKFFNFAISIWKLYCKLWNIYCFVDI